MIAAAAGLIGSPLGHRLAKAKAEHLHRELPFALHVAARPLGPDLLVRGQIDALLLEEGAALVIDYKLAAPHQSARYDLQLDTYGLAVHELVAGQLPVRTALAFLKGPARELAERPPLDDAGRAALRLRIADAGAAIAQGRAQGRFATIEAASCKALGCGFLARCHGAAAEAEPKIALAAEPKVAVDANRRGQLVLPW